MMMERVGDRWETMEGYCSAGQSSQRAVVPVEEEEAEGEEEEEATVCRYLFSARSLVFDYAVNKYRHTVASCWILLI
jgi:hypothetical protein